MMVNLVDLECSIAYRLLKEKFKHCLVIGKDLIRWLINVGTFNPQIKAIWHEILTNKLFVSPDNKETTLTHLLKRKTPRPFIIDRIPIELEKRVHWMLHSVPASKAKLHLTWLENKYFSVAGPASQSLRVDLIRHICINIHPKNEVLQSNIIQRWQLICHLMQGINNNPTLLMQCRFALFYDWFFHDPKVAYKIMDLEPALLCIRHGRKIDSRIPNQLFDFCMKTISSFDHGTIDFMITNFKEALKNCEKVKVINSVKQVTELVSPVTQKLIEQVLNLDNLSPEQLAMKTNVVEDIGFQPEPVKTEPQLFAPIPSSDIKEESSLEIDEGPGPSVPIAVEPVKSLSPNYQPNLDSGKSLLSSLDEFDNVDFKDISEFINTLPPGLQEFVEQSNEHRGNLEKQKEAIEEIIMQWSISREAETDVEALVELGWKRCCLGLEICISSHHQKIPDPTLPVPYEPAFASPSKTTLMTK